MATYLTQIGNWFYYLRRVPSYVKPYDNRKFIRVSLRTKDQREAERSASIYDDFMEKYWTGLIQRGAGDQRRDYFQKIKQMAQAHGLAYRNVAAVAELPLNELITRVELAEMHNTPTARSAFLGDELEEPQMLLSDCLEKYWPLIEDRLTEKSQFQLRKYKVPRQTAFEKFIAVVGDKPLSSIERSDILSFRTWLMQRIADGEIAGNTANKQLTSIKDILARVGMDQQLENDFEMLFIKTRFATTKKPRPPFEASYVLKSFVKGSTLDRLNREARLLLRMMIETGARPGELIGLLPREDFFLDHEIPHIWVRKNKIRELKTGASERQIPLVGVSLEAAREISSSGFTRYWGCPDNASNTVNKFLWENNLVPSKRHVLYSLRHTFKDRLRDVEAPEEIINELMGHSQPGPAYGRGRLLRQKYEWIKRIAFEVP